MCSTRAARSPRGRPPRSGATSTWRRPTSARPGSRTARMPDTTLELRDVEVRYGAVPALRGASIAVRRGEVEGLIGPNGAGKSTLLHAVMGDVPVSRGAILFEGQSVVGIPTERIARRGI